MVLQLWYTMLRRRRRKKREKKKQKRESERKDYQTNLKVKEEKKKMGNRKGIGQGRFSAHSSTNY